MDEESSRALENLVRTFGAEAPLIEAIRSFALRTSKVLADHELAAKLGGIAIAVANAQTAVRRFELEGPAIVAAVHARGLMVPFGQMSLHDVTRLADLHQHHGPTAVVEAVEAEYDNFFSRPDCLEVLLTSWNSSPTLRPRMPILRDAVSAHRHRLFGVSIPALIAQTEGLIVTLRGHTGQVDGRTLRGLVKETVKHDTFIGPLLSAFFTDTLLKQFRHGDTVGPFSRHAILHGADVSYATEANSQTALFLVDSFVPYEEEPAGPAT